MIIYLLKINDFQHLKNQSTRIISLIIYKNSIHVYIDYFIIIYK